MIKAKKYNHSAIYKDIYILLQNQFFSEISEIMIARKQQ